MGSCPSSSSSPLLGHARVFSLPGKQVNARGLQQHCHILFGGGGVVLEHGSASILLAKQDRVIT